MEILVGTAGHIDHGKTSLVRRLTGIDTDRLPAEKARGISIDLGFAHFEFRGMRFGIVDVPGHERFVRNMVAGATGINVALLVVAADDGVMPQTREHLDIMDLLGVRAGLIAVTKSDLVEPDLIDLVREDISAAVEGTFLERCPIVAVSSVTGAGIDELQQRLVDVCRTATFEKPLPLFRLPIDRVFSIAGHGTVVTGSTLSGEVRVSDVLDLWPTGREVRVRSVEHHGQSATDAKSGQRTAINLAGVKLADVQRGCELASHGYLQPTRRLLVELRSLNRAAGGIKHRMEVMLHLGTTEVVARVSIKGQTLEPGQQAYADLRLREPVVATWGQRFIVRRISPAMTLGGGRILDPCVEDASSNRIRDLNAVCQPLASSSAIERLSACLSRCDDVRDQELSIVRATGIDPAEVPSLLMQLREQKQLVSLGQREQRVELHITRLTHLVKVMARTIREEVLKHQPRRSLPKPMLLTACRDIAASPLLELLIEQLIIQKELAQIGENLGPADLQVRLTKQQRQLYDSLWRQLSNGALTPPTFKEMVLASHQQTAEVDRLLSLMIEECLIIRAGNDVYFTRAAIESARVICCELFATSGPAAMSQLRDAWGVTRKFAIPLCECLDELGITTRAGDLRIPGLRLDVPLIDRPLQS